MAKGEGEAYHRKKQEYKEEQVSPNRKNPQAKKIKLYVIAMLLMMVGQLGMIVLNSLEPKDPDTNPKSNQCQATRMRPMPMNMTPTEQEARG